MTEQEINKTFAENLVRLINLRGLSQVDVAKALDVSESAVSLWCAGKTSPRMRKVDMLCQLLNCTRSQLLGSKTPDAILIEHKMRPLLIEAQDATEEEIQQAARYLAYLKATKKG